MGCVQSSVEKEAAERSKKIDQELRRDGIESCKELKLLVLGGEHSGKSTIVKQMCIIYGTGYSPEDCKKHKALVHSNTIRGLANIIRAMKNFGIDYAGISRLEDARKYIEISDNSREEELTPELVQLMKLLWRDQGVQYCFSRSRENRSNDSTAYFLNDLDRIASTDYVPTQIDVLRTTVRTTGLNETQFTFKGLHFTMFDIGGCRCWSNKAEKMKWMHALENPSAIIFCVDLSGYGLVLAEDEDTNCMMESIKLFDRVCNNKWWGDSLKILFLNKKDLFEGLLQHRPLTSCFPEYQGPDTYEDSAAYIQTKFENFECASMGRKESVHSSNMRNRH